MIPTRSATGRLPEGGIPVNAPHVPTRGTKLYKLLALLLKGIEVDPGYAYEELNLPTLQARCSELRKLGWPVRAIEKPHHKLINERTTVYLLDSGFRRWVASNPQAHPFDYGVSDGRGKYANKTGASRE